MAQTPRVDDFGLEHEEHDWILGEARAVNPIAPGIQLGSHRPDVFSALDENVGVALEHADSFARGGSQHSR